MAELSDHDLRLIHGDNYQQNAYAAGDRSNPEYERQRIAEELEKRDNQRFGGQAVALLGIALLWSAWYAGTGTAGRVQAGIALAIVVIGAALAWHANTRFRKAQADSDARKQTLGL